MEVKTNNMNSWKVVSYILMAIFTLITIGPLLWTFFSSLKPHALIVQEPFKMFREWSLKNYISAWKLGEMGILFLNSLFYSTVATIGTVYLALAAGYAFAKFGFKISKFFYAFFAAGLLITVHSVLVPLFVMENWIGIDNTRIGVLIPYIGFGLPFQVYLATSFVKSLPTSLEEAARIDGATYMQVFWRIVIPMAVPVTVTMLIYAFLGNWNEFVLIMVLTSDSAIRSLPAGINAFAGGMARNYGFQFAALCIGTIPMILFYVAFRKQIAKGFAAGSLKE
ncbi:MAG: carbohydrate ABC transporter permease [Bacteroidetes bacterium]|nr:carbohydrate ABC transporter permease [Bacteroidota bacterium]